MTDTLYDSNYFTSPRLCIDTDSDGRADGVLAATKDDLTTPVAGSPVYTRILNSDGSYSQRIQYTYTATDSTQIYIPLALTDVGSFAPGDAITGSLYVEEITLTGCSDPRLHLWARQAAGGFVSCTEPGANVAVGGNEESIASAGALTSRAQMTLTAYNFSEGDALDITFRSVQIEASAAATEYFDGSKENCSWVGTEDASVSIRALGSLVFEGDSLTVGTGSTAGNDYPTLCAPDGQWAKYNVGGGSETAAQMLVQATEQVDVHYHPLAPRNMVVFWAGINDIALGASAGALINNIASYCTVRRAAGWDVVVATITPCQGNDVASGKEAIRQTVNASLRVHWPTYANALADIASDSRIGDKGDEDDATYFTVDKVHFNDVGYGIVAGIVEAAIDSSSGSASESAVASIALSVAAISSAVFDIKAKTDTFPADWVNIPAGVGAITWPYTLTTNGTTPIPDAEVWVTSDIAGDNVIASGRTDAYGVVNFYLDAGTVYVWSQKSGYNFVNPDTEVVA